MVAIRPFRRLIVYPPMIRQIERSWRARSGDRTPAYAHTGWTSGGTAPATAQDSPHVIAATSVSI
jgi:hypothetical protein